MNRQHKLVEPHRQYNFLIEAKQYERLKDKADEMMTTPAAIVRRAIDDFLGTEEEESNGRNYPDTERI
jgi:hypothetical protein